MSLIPLPQRCTLAVTHAAEDPKATPTPTITTSFDSFQEGYSPLLQQFELVTGAKIELDPCEEREGHTTVTFTVIHDCGEDDCPTLISKVLFDIPNQAIAEFEAVYDAHKSFLWICSTPTYEGRAVVNKSTSRIATKVAEGRTLH